MNPLQQQMLINMAQAVTTRQLTKHLLADGFPQRLIDQLIQLLEDNRANYTR